MTIPKRLSNLALPLMSELETSAKTRTGAIAFRAPTNKSPKIPIHENFGKNIPKTAPKTIPIKIRKIKLAEL